MPSRRPAPQPEPVPARCSPTSSVSAMSTFPDGLRVPEWARRKSPAFTMTRSSAPATLIPPRRLIISARCRSRPACHGRLAAWDDSLPGFRPGCCGNAMAGCQAAQQRQRPPVNPKRVPSRPDAARPWRKGLPGSGFEPPTGRETTACSNAELPRNRMILSQVPRPISTYLGIKVAVAFIRRHRRTTKISRIADAANWAQASARVRKCLIDNAGSVRLDPRRLDQRGVRPDLAADHRLELAWRNFQLIGAEFGELLGQRRRRQRFDDLSV
jgi:hypothetical protein